jgi:CheY-like chemotaxis protein
VQVLDFAAATPEEMGKLNPALIILDILKADEQAGWPLLAALKQNPDTTTIPVIVCSVLNNPDKARRLGASSYIAKPVDETFLISEVARLVRAHRQHVLIADDESITRLMLRDILVMDGYHVTTVTDGNAAIEVLKRGWPDLVILDLLMPNLNGFAVLEWIRGERKNLDIPVIVLTAAELTPAEREMIVKYASAYTVKSNTSPQQLLDLVKQSIAVES